MKSAVIGIGNVGKIHCDILKGEGLLSCVCDTDPSRFKEHPDIPSYTDYRLMLEKERPDAVHICTPHFLHAEMITFALNMGINVLCEKPMCISGEEIETILEAEKRSGAQLGFCLQNRYNPENQFVKKYLKGQKVTCAVAHMAWKRSSNYYASGEWRGKWISEGGGVLINQAMHTLDLLQYFAGMPEKITAFCANLTHGDSIEVEDTAVLISTAGAPITFFATNSAAISMPVELTLKTETEIIKVMPDCVLINNSFQQFNLPIGPFPGKTEYGRSHKLLITDFYNHLSSGEPFPINGSEAAKVMRLILAAYRSEGAETPVR